MMTNETLIRRRHHRPRPTVRAALLSPALALESVTLVAWSGIVWLLAAWVPSPAWSLISFCDFVWLCALLFRIAPRATVLALPDLVGQASTVVALIFIEYGGRIPELAAVGDAGPWSASFVFYSIVLFGSYASFFHLFAEHGELLRQSPMTPLFNRWSNWVAIAIVGLAGLIMLWLLFRGVAKGFPLFEGIDRFVYRRQADKVTLYALNLKFVILVALGLVAFRLPAWLPWRIMAGLIGGLLLAIYFLFGDKFFTQIVAASGFAAPFLYIHHRRVRRFLGLFLAAGAITLGIASAMTYYIYSNKGAMTREATMDRLSGRIVGQGELWFLQARIGAPLLTWDGQFVARNIAALHIKNIDLYAVQQSLGPNYFSNQYAPNKIRLSIANNAGTSTYPAALEPLGLAVFGWIGLGLLLVACGGLMALVLTYLAFGIASRSIISTLFAAYLLVQVRTALSQGAPWVFMSVFAMKWLAVIFFIELVLYAVGRAQQGPRYVMSSGTRLP